MTATVRFFRALDQTSRCLPCSHMAAGHHNPAPRSISTVDRDGSKYIRRLDQIMLREAYLLTPSGIRDGIGREHVADFTTTMSGE